MTPDEIVESAALASLGALDGEDRALFEQSLNEGAGRRDLEAFEAVVARLGLAVDPVPPGPAVRARVLAATRPEPRPATTATPARAFPRDRFFAQLAAAAALILAIGFVVMWVERNAARAALAEARWQAETARADAQHARAELAQAQERLAQDARFKALVGHPDALLVNLGPLPPAPKARARVVFHRGNREAVLMVSGLEPAPAGKAYEVWTIGKAAAPVPAGVFQVDAAGSAVFRLPPVQAAEDVKTFAVTLEPAAGVPAPTGPMVLAGAVS